MSKKPVWAVAFALERAGVPCADALAWMLRKRHVHSYTPIVTAPTCTEAGYTTHLCDCGDSYTSDAAAALGHSAGAAVEENRVEATGEAAGSYDSVVYCTRCGAELSRETVTLPQLKLKGYLYNGVLLPAFEDGITEEYPYAVWRMDGAGSCRLEVFQKPVYARVTSIDEEECHNLANAGSSGIKYCKFWGLKDGSTSFPSLYKSYDLTLAAYDSVAILSYSTSPPLFLWSSFDLYEAEYVSGKYQATDTLFYPKSPDPVPVYE